MPKFKVTYSAIIEAPDEQSITVQGYVQCLNGLEGGTVVVEEVDEFGQSLPVGDGETTCIRCGYQLDPKDTSDLDPDDPRNSFCSDDCQAAWHETH